ncbi:MAG: hypothetical protein CFH31_00953 [Alphaproteobacteria bacterium MarineAlpha9_Bin1]|nr:MAG: hypothetical protein CFH31_00953 [Alphaproteobacteria bacterium MarineAlpha9_Bin1]
MINYLKIFLVSFLTFLLFSGCASHNIEKVKNLPDNKNKFSEALSDAYLEFALYELNDMHDEWDANHFAQKSLSAKRGEEVLPEITSDWGIDESVIEEANTKRNEIIITLNDDGSKEFPVLAARSQLGFDCWLEQLEEGWQQDHIKRCYDMMNNSLSTLKQNLLAHSSKNSPIKQISEKTNIVDKSITKIKIIADKNTPEKNRVYTKKIKIYFEHNSYILNEKALNDLEKFSEKTDEGYTRILLEGHTDRSGTERYNFNLAKLRAKTVKDFLLKKGLDKKTIITKVFGESRPLIHTKDGEREPKNRRVSIEVSYDQNLLSRL